MTFQRKSTFLILISTLFLFYSCTDKPDIKTEKRAVDACADAFLQNFKQEKITGIENLLSGDTTALFVFYDSSLEPCNSTTFISYLKQYFIEISAVDIAMNSHNISLNSTASTAWFLYTFNLRYDKEGFSEFRKNVRMSGVCIKESGHWKISQLHFSQPTSR